MLLLPLACFSLNTLLTLTDVMAVFHNSAQLVQVEESLVEQFTICCSQQALDSLPKVVADTRGHGDTGQTPGDMVVQVKHLETW